MPPALCNQSLFFCHSLTQTSQRVDAVNVHGATSANTLSATPSEGESRVGLVLDPDQRVEHHGAGLVEVERVLLHARLAGRLIRVPSVDLELLNPGLRVGLGLANGGRLLRGHGAALRALDDRGHAATEDLGRHHAP